MQLERTTGDHHCRLYHNPPFYAQNFRAIYEKRRCHDSGERRGVHKWDKGSDRWKDQCCHVLSTPIPTEIPSCAEFEGLQIKVFPFAIDLIVPIVHPSNSVINLNSVQLAGIYAGKIRTWKDVGGLSESIEVVARKDSSGTGKVWQKVVMKSESVRPDAVLQDSNSGVLAYVAEHREAIGYIGYALLNHEVKSLSVKGVVPNRENAGKGRYPISRRLYLYVDQRRCSTISNH